ncbi:hypothetical protein ACP70R_037140 [Stipagrostis hirtigluma subsp. patula]
MDNHVVETLAEDGGMLKQQQRLVRERGRRIKAAAELGLARSSRGRQWGRALGRRALLVTLKEPLSDATLPSSEEQEPEKKKKAAPPLERRGEEAEEEEEEVVVEEKVAQLRQLVPGGEEMAVEGLLEETADYIAALRAQVGVMRALACLLSGSGLDSPPPEKAGLLLAPEKPQ